MHVISPADGIVLNKSPTVFAVQNAEDPEGKPLTYTFTIASDNKFEQVIDTGEVPEGVGTTEFITAKPFKSGVYFWRVTASDGAQTASITATFAVIIPQVTGGGLHCSSASPEDAVSFAAIGVVIGGLLKLRRRRNG